MKTAEKLLTVKEVTKILKEYGIVSNENGTRKLIRQGRLQAKLNGSEHDRRAGFSVTESNLSLYLQTHVSDFSKLQHLKDNNLIHTLLSSREAYDYLKQEGLLTHSSLVSFGNAAKNGRIPCLVINEQRKFQRDELRAFAETYIGKQDGKGYVYLLHDTNQNLYKIGKTTKAPYLRLQEIEQAERYVGNDVELKLIHFITSEQALLTERLLQQHFMAQKCVNKRDWFSLTTRDVQWFVLEKFRQNQVIVKSLEK